MTILMQGMRRSGTTIIYDALCQDPELTCWYEPLAAARQPAMGGGSGMQDVDLFATVRPEREAFARARGVAFEELNHGAPRDATLEFEPGLPAIVRDWISHLIDRPGPVMAKFTRMYRHADILAELAPGAAFIHLVRDPRAVVASYLFGKGQRNRAKFPTADVYFDRRSQASAWSSRPFSELVLAQPGWEQYADPTDLERILLIWRFTFEETRRRGQAAFGKRYRLLRHEDLCHDPLPELAAVYALDGRPVPAAVRTWAVDHVRPAREPYAADDARWDRAFARLDLEPAVQAAGYAAPAGRH